MPKPTDLPDDDRVMALLVELAPRMRCQALIHRYLINGARFFMRRTEDDTLEVVLGFTADHKKVAARRAYEWGTEPGEPTEVELGEALLLAKDVPIDVVMPKAQG